MDTLPQQGLYSLRIADITPENAQAHSGRRIRGIVDIIFPVITHDAPNSNRPPTQHIEIRDIALPSAEPPTTRRFTRIPLIFTGPWATVTKRFTRGDIISVSGPGVSIQRAEVSDDSSPTDHPCVVHLAPTDGPLVFIERHPPKDGAGSTQLDDFLPPEMLQIPNNQSVALAGTGLSNVSASVTNLVSATKRRRVEAASVHPQPIAVPVVPAVASSTTTPAAATASKYRYTPLAGLRAGTANVYGVVVNVSGVFTTSGSDLRWTVSLSDESLPAGQQVDLVVFANKHQSVPPVRAAGDILRAHRVKIDMFNHKFSLVAKTGRSAFVLLSKKGEFASSKKYTELCVTRIKELKLHANSLLVSSHLSCRNMFAEYVKSLNQIQNSVSAAANPYDTITSSDNRTFDMLCQVVSLVYPTEESILDELNNVNNRLHDSSAAAGLPSSNFKRIALVWDGTGTARDQFRDDGDNNSSVSNLNSDANVVGQVGMVAALFADLNFALQLMKHKVLEPDTWIRLRSVTAMPERLEDGTGWPVMIRLQGDKKSHPSSVMQMPPHSAIVQQLKRTASDAQAELRNGTVREQHNNTAVRGLNVVGANGMTSFEAALCANRSLHVTSAWSIRRNQNSASTAGAASSVAANGAMSSIPLNRTLSRQGSSVSRTSAGISLALAPDAVVFRAFHTDDLLDPNEPICHVVSLRSLKTGAPRAACLARVIVRVVAINPACAADICQPRPGTRAKHDDDESESDNEYVYNFAVWLADNSGCVEARVCDDETGNDGTRWMAGLVACDLSHDIEARIKAEQHLRKLLQPLHWVDCLLASCPTACGNHFRVVASRTLA